MSMVTTSTRGSVTLGGGSHISKHGTFGNVGSRSAATPSSSNTVTLSKKSTATATGSGNNSASSPNHTATSSSSTTSSGGSGGSNTSRSNHHHRSTTHKLKRLRSVKPSRKSEEKQILLSSSSSPTSKLLTAIEIEKFPSPTSSSDATHPEEEVDDDDESLEDERPKVTDISITASADTVGLAFARDKDGFPTGPSVTGVKGGAKSDRSGGAASRRRRKREAGEDTTELRGEDLLEEEEFTDIPVDSFSPTDTTATSTTSSPGSTPSQTGISPTTRQNVGVLPDSGGMQFLPAFEDGGGGILEKGGWCHAGKKNQAGADLASTEGSLFEAEFFDFDHARSEVSKSRDSASVSGSADLAGENERELDDGGVAESEVSADSTGGTSGRKFFTSLRRGGRNRQGASPGVQAPASVAGGNNASSVLQPSSHTTNVPTSSSSEGAPTKSSPAPSSSNMPGAIAAVPASPILTSATTAGSGSNPMTATSVGSSGKKSGKVSRLAQLFSSRNGKANLQAGNGPPTTGTTASSSRKNHRPPTNKRPTHDHKRSRSFDIAETTSNDGINPPSPCRSSVSGTSSGYVGWPGTQDPKGGTVALQPSYDESEDTSLSTARMEKEKDRHDNDNGNASCDSDAGEDGGVKAPLEEQGKPSMSPLSSVRRSCHGGNEDSTPTCDDGDDDSDSESGNPADFALTVAVADAAAAASSPLVVRSSPHDTPRYYERHQLTKSNIKASMTHVSLGGDAIPRSSSKITGGFSPSPGRMVTASPPAQRPTRAGTDIGSENGSINIQNLFGTPKTNGTAVASRSSTPSTRRKLFQTDPSDPWDIDDIPSGVPSPTKSTSNQPVSSPPFSALRHESIDTTQSEIRIRNRNSSPQPPTEAALTKHTERSGSILKPIPGFRAYLDKTRDVPNLMDDVESETDTVSTQSTRDVRTRVKGMNLGLGLGLKEEGVEEGDEGEEEESINDENKNDNADVAGSQKLVKTGSDVFAGTDSDVFDGLSSVGPSSFGANPFDGLKGLVRQRESYDPIDEQKEEYSSKPLMQAGMNVLKINGLATIQATAEAYANRSTSVEFDAGLSDADVDHFGTQGDSKKKLLIPGTGMGKTLLKKGRPGKFLLSSRSQSGGESSYEVIPTNRSNRSLPGPSVGPPPTTNKIKPAPFENSLLFTEGNGVIHTDTAESSSDPESYSPDDSEGEDPPDLSVYYVQPHLVRKLVRKYRKMCKAFGSSSQDGAEEDFKKAFALFEMRSRVMETDIERGLERRGGTVPVDDLVTTPYQRAAHRVRDAVIVSKAWRDGASPRDVVTASLLTRRMERTYCVRRRIRVSQRNYNGSGGWHQPHFSSNESICSSNSSGDRSYQQSMYTYEEVRWVDDADFSRFRCPSLGPRCMRGFEMFTIGDCQSILLKLTNERVMLLRKQLNEATSIQIEAEDLMKEEADAGYDPIYDQDGMMTEAEMTYLAAMEEVKTVSKQLVVAEKSFQLVRDRIERLVAKYEAILVKIEDNDGDCSSVESFHSYGSDDDADYDSQYDSEEEDREKKVLARRAQRAELKAEVAAREAMLAKQEAEKLREEKQRELDVLQKKLADMETMSVNMASEYERRLANNIPKAQHKKVFAGGRDTTDTQTFLQSAHGQETNSNKLEAKERIKAKFRSRHAERQVRKGPPTTTREGLRTDGETADYMKDLYRINRHRLTGEEMYQHLDFYERSLKAVENKNLEWPN